MAKNVVPATPVDPDKCDAETMRSAIDASCGGWSGVSDDTIAAKWASTPRADRVEMLAVLAAKRGK